MKQKITEHKWVQYEFTEAEFKRGLGISDDSHGVLDVSVSFGGSTVTVTMSNAPE